MASHHQSVSPALDLLTKSAKAVFTLILKYKVLICYKVAVALVGFDVLGDCLVAQLSALIEALTRLSVSIA